MAKKKLAVVDFETEAIDTRPDYPPRPVGVAIRDPGGRKGRYLSWGHPSENNSTQGLATSILAGLWSDPDVEIAFHHGKFDQEVAHVHMGLPLLPPEKWQDSMILAFLDNPYAWSLELKPLAEKELGEPPTERDALKDWIVEHVPEARQKKSEWGRYISRAPGGIVGDYAVGDVERTHGLVKKLLPRVCVERGMREPYERELKLTPILIRNEREGISVDLLKLRGDVQMYDTALATVDEWIGKYLKTPGLDVDKNDRLADAIDRAGKAEGGWLLTPKEGKRSTSKESIDHAVSDKLLVAALSYRGSLATCLRTFMHPWLRVAERTGGRIHTNWHSTRGQDMGARTGRLSSSPNFQNIPTDFEDEMLLFAAVKFFERLAKMGVKLPPLPQVRSYIVSDGKAHVLCGRDYSSQELRVLAHYEDGVMADEYRRDPTRDMHQYVADMIKEMFQILITRRSGKTLNFLKVYGGGVAKLALKMGVDMETARRIMNAYLRVFPGLKDLNDEMKRRGRANEPIKTLGGRLYYAEPGRIVKGAFRTFEYKLLNYLIQGSSADMTKEAVIRYDAVRGDSRLLLTVHDEILIGSPRRCWKAEMKKLRDAMQSIALDVPLLSEGEVGQRWTEMEKCA